MSMCDCYQIRSLLADRFGSDVHLPSNASFARLSQAAICLCSRGKCVYVTFLKALSRSFASRCRALRCGFLILHAPSICATTSWLSLQQTTSSRVNVEASSRPAISAWYSASLFVFMPIAALCSFKTAPSSVAIRYPIAAFPGLFLDAPSVYNMTFERRGSQSSGFSLRLICFCCVSIAVSSAPTFTVFVVYVGQIVEVAWARA